MQGQASGMMGMFLKFLQLDPVVFISALEANKMLTAESKVFSIYSTGEVPGYQRKTHVRLHTVVDFRGAPAPGAAPAAVDPTKPPVRPNTPPVPTTLPGTTGQPTDALSGALAPNPGGTIVYYRTD
jgi:hypothetical protein